MNEYEIKPKSNKICFMNEFNFFRSLSVCIYLFIAEISENVYW